MARLAFVDLPAMNYLYVTRSCAPDADSMSAAMGSAFEAVIGFMRQAGIEAAGPPLAVYPRQGEDKLDFRAGFPVAAADVYKASGPVKADRTPGGRVLRAVHVGPYGDLGETYATIRQHLFAEGLSMAYPTWEIYIDDPFEISEEVLRTEVYVPVQ